MAAPGHVWPPKPGAVSGSAIDFDGARLWHGLSSERELSSAPGKGCRQMGKAKDVRTAVEAKLSFDPLVNSAGITVVNIGGPNEIDISYLIDPVDVNLHVQQALDRSALVPDGSDVRADTKDGIITL